MQEPGDFELDRDPDEHGPYSAPERSRGPWILAAVLAVAAAAGAYWLLRGGSDAPAPVTAERESVDVATDSVGPLGGEPMPGVVPELGESDTFVRELLRHLSQHPRLAAWLATDGLVRNFTVVVSNVSEGRTPAGHVPVLRPAGDFRIIENGEELFIDPRSYTRYNDLADAAASVDPAGMAEIYATLKPRLEEAHRELGAPEGVFDQTLERAIVQLLRTPVPQEPVRLRPAVEGIGYAFADPRYESLTGAQKQLLRMGPRNVRLVKSALHDIALELGIPAERLPPQQVPQDRVP